MAFQILTTTAASITELKRDQWELSMPEGAPVAILNRNEPAFYCASGTLCSSYGYS